MLTPDKLALLEAPFALNEHGYNSGGQPFIIKSAIRRRLSKVDSLWGTNAPVLVARDGDVVSVSLGLAICGATRHGLGTGVVLTSTKNGEVFSGAKAAEMLKKAYKSAASDALARAAMEFNVGMYLKSKPGDIQKPEFPTWLAKLDQPHWASNGGRERIAAWLDGAGLVWQDVNALVEPGRTLTMLNDTTLTEPAFMERLRALRKPAAPKQLAPDFSNVLITDRQVKPRDIIQRRGAGGRPAEVLSINWPFANVRYTDDATTAELKLENPTVNWMLIGGPQLDAARQNPALLKFNPGPNNWLLLETAGGVA